MAPRAYEPSLFETRVHHPEPKGDENVEKGAQSQTEKIKRAWTPP